MAFGGRAAVCTPWWHQAPVTVDDLIILPFEPPTRIGRLTSLAPTLLHIVIAVDHHGIFQSGIALCRYLLA
eukprot:COSAG01_NODE_170_length_23136_cov_24.853931_21_plen_71_part_00